MKIEEFEKKINYKFTNKKLLNTALTHASFNKKKKDYSSYERLEFLGDRVLSLVIAQDLFLKFPKEDEGALSKRHAYLVSKSILIEVSTDINIKEVLKSFSAKNLNPQIQTNSSIFGDICEALIGAIYLDSGLIEAKKFIKKYWTKKINKNINPPKDPKSLLQEIAQKKGLKLPKYNLKLKTGPSYSPLFDVEVLLTGFKKFTARGKTIKIAQLNAANNLLKFMREKKII